MMDKAVSFYKWAMYFVGIHNIARGEIWLGLQCVFAGIVLVPFAWAMIKSMRRLDKERGGSGSIFGWARGKKR